LPQELFVLVYPSVSLLADKQSSSLPNRSTVFLEVSWVEGIKGSADDVWSMTASASSSQFSLSSPVVFLLTMVLLDPWVTSVVETRARKKIALLRRLPACPPAFLLPLFFELERMMPM
jgi:hypothetical protein